MSTKIYNGLMCRTTDIAQEIEALQALRPEIDRIARTVMSSYVAKSLASRIDIARHAGQHIPKGLFTKTIWEMMDRQHKSESNNTRDPEVDVQASVVLLPSKDCLLAIAYAENTLIHDALTAAFEPFAYWDNTDPPEDISLAEWDEREELWNTALARDPHHRPSGCGPVIEFPTPVFMPMPKEVCAHLPTREVRARNLARHVLLEKQTPKDADIHTIMQIVASSAFDAQVRDQTPTFLPLLGDITPSDLIG